jgi:DivIVA domain-containing protein
MTLSLDDVRNKRFRMARKSGYEVLEVDEFVDEVEVAFEQLTEENQNLKKQIEALKAAPATEDVAPTPVEAAPAEPETIVVTTGAEASSAVVRLVSLSTEQAEQLVSEATAEAAKIREDAASSAQELTGDARARADRITTDAQQAAERVQAEARSRADGLDSEIAGRRSELLDGLNAERDALQVAVGQLRTFEAGFRANLVNELHEHISSLEGRNAQPAEVPALADPAAVAAAEQVVLESPAATEAGTVDGITSDTDADGGDDTPVSDSVEDGGSVFPNDDPAEDDGPDRVSETPRLDALLGDQR